jgi:hypothetical protein
MAEARVEELQKAVQLEKEYNERYTQASIKGRNAEVEATLNNARATYGQELKELRAWHVRMTEQRDEAVRLVRLLVEGRDDILSEQALAFIAGLQGAAHTFAPVMQDSPRDLLRNLLAVIHRDGGHYAAEHGLEKAVSDAMSLVTDLRVKAPTVEVPVAVSPPTLLEELAVLEEKLPGGMASTPATDADEDVTVIREGSTKNNQNTDTSPPRPPLGPRARAQMAQEVIERDVRKAKAEEPAPGVPRTVHVNTFLDGFQIQLDGWLGWLSHHGLAFSCVEGETVIMEGSAFATRRAFRVYMDEENASQLRELQKQNPARFGSRWDQRVHL